MTVAIKGMDMPKSCKECYFLDMGIRVNVCKVLDEKVENISNARRWNCPLIDLPEENKDMSWEELVEKCRQIKTVNMFINPMAFILNDGEMQLSCSMGSNLSISIKGSQWKNIKCRNYFEMYQIIKALIGDER